MKKILVTGGYGFIAGHTVEALIDKGVEVVTNVRSVIGSYLEYDPYIEYMEYISTYVVDSRDVSGMRAIIEKVDGVINLAGTLGTKNVDPKSYKVFYENNVFTANNIMSHCIEFNTPFVQITVGNWFENNRYSNTKVAVERDVLMNIKYNGLKGKIVRGLNAYGPRQKIKNTGKIIPTFIYQALKGEPLNVYGGEYNCGVMDMIYVKDLANILIKALDKADGKKSGLEDVIEAGTGDGFSVWEIAETIVGLTNSKSEIIEVPMRLGESRRSRVIANNPFPYNYTDLETGLKETIKYYKSVI